MNKYLKVFGILSLLCFSFYYTEEIASFMRSKDPIYESIKAIEREYQVDFVNAEIQGATIIPGLCGQVINLDKSFNNMKSYGFFRESDLVFDEVKPEVSLEQNKDKIIEKGNPKKQAVTIVTKEEEVIAYLEQMGVSYNVLVTEDNVENIYKNGTKINNDTQNYDEVEKKLKLKKEKNDFCFTQSDTSFCQTKKKKMFKSTVTLNRSNFLTNYNKITSGSIIFIEANIGTSNLNRLIESIAFRGLSITSLTELLSESRTSLQP